VAFKDCLSIFIYLKLLLLNASSDLNDRNNDFLFSVHLKMEKDEKKNNSLR